VVYGELLVTPAPRVWHQVLVHRLSVAIELYLRTEPAGMVFTAPADISWGRDVLVQPDVFVVVPEEARTLTWSRVQTLLLVAEVLGPSTARGDRMLKRLRYREAGVPLYWLVDGDERSVEVWTPADDFPAIEREPLARQVRREVAGTTASKACEIRVWSDIVEREYPCNPLEVSDIRRHEDRPKFPAGISDENIEDEAAPDCLQVQSFVTYQRCQGIP
jgi:Uma2 family endonuclease